MCTYNTLYTVTKFFTFPANPPNLLCGSVKPVLWVRKPVTCSWGESVVVVTTGMVGSLVHADVSTAAGGSAVP